MRWIIPKTKQDQEIRLRPSEQIESETIGIFNVPLAENDGGIAVLEPTCKAVVSPRPYEAPSSGQFDADEDIRSDRVKRFDDPEDMIASLKEPW